MPADLDPQRLTAERVAALHRLLGAPLPANRGIDRDEARQLGYLALHQYRHRRRRYEGR